MPLQQNHPVETLLYRHFAICLNEYDTICSRDTSCGTLENVSGIETLLVAL